MITLNPNIDWVKIFDFLERVDWSRVIITCFWIMLIYGTLVFVSLTYAFLKSKIWWDESFFKAHITRSIERNIPISYNEKGGYYCMQYKGFYFHQIIFKKKENDCVIKIEGNPISFFIGLFGNCYLNLNLDREEDYEFFNMICTHSGYVPPEKELVDYSKCVPWITEQIKKYGYYTHLRKDNKEKYLKT